MARRIPSQRFDELIRAATAVFLEQGFRRAQMDEVAARLGLAKGTIYLYVDGKDALFDAVLEHADAPHPISTPASLPLPAPKPRATLDRLRRRIAQAGSLTELRDSLRRRRVDDPRAELGAIVRELYRMLARHRVGIKLLDRCAHDHPELAAVWSRSGRAALLELLRSYIDKRIRRRLFAPVPDVAVTARLILETAVYWAVHRHWDREPESFDEDEVEETVVLFAVRMLCSR